MTTPTDIDVLYLPSDLKLQFCLDLLESVGAEKISVRENRNEIIHCCLAPWHNETHPSASLNFDKMVYRCLPADTMVKTYDGDRPIGELAGKTARLLDGDGKWVQAPVWHFGKDRLYRVTLSRNGVKRDVYATADHRWYIRPEHHYGVGKDGLREVTTLDLKPKTRIPSVWAMNRTGRTTISPVGVMAGFVYGDGTQTVHGAHANFYGPKDQALLPYFEGYVARKHGDLTKISAGLPRSWKRLPDLDEGASYLWGWLAGYFAADGCVADDGHVTLSCADPDTLRFVQTVCDRLGIGTYTLSTRSRVGRSGSKRAAEASDIFTLSFRASTLRPEFFVIPSHRERYEEGLSRRKYERTHWWVVSVEETDRVEDVYCAEVPSTNSFVLADNILTGNCLGCPAKGGILWLIGITQGVYGPEARNWLAEQTGTGGKEFQLAPLLQFLDAIEAARTKSKTPAPIPRFSESVLEPWNHIYPGLTTGVPELGIEGRGIPEANLIEARVGWDMDDNRIIIPHFWKGDLVGWQGRRILDAEAQPEKYKSTPDFPRDSTIYRQPEGKRIIVVESPMSVLKHLHHLPIGGTFGSAITDRQLALLRWYPEVIFWVDPDPAGWGNLEGHWDEKGIHHPGAAQQLEAYSTVKVVASDWAGDPAEFDDDTAETLVDEAIPLAIWSKPEALRCMACHNYHGGPCG